MSSAGASSSKREHREKLYFPNGDVILEAKGDPPVLFRVHRWLLSHHSPVFRDMFSLPAPRIGATDEVYDGVPVVKMADAAEDLEKLLKILYYPSELSFRRMDPAAPSQVAGPLRLARKYEIDDLRQRLVQQITADWPVTLSEWERQQAEFAATERQFERDRNLKQWDAVSQLYLADVIPEPASAIAFAREFGCDAILPAAFYRVAVAGIEEDWDNLEERADDRPLVRWKELPAEDLVRVLRARREMHTFWDEQSAWEVLMSASCAGKRRAGCRLYLEQFTTPLWSGAHRDTFDPLKVLAGLIENEDGPDVSLCPSCRFSLQRWLSQEKERVWASIPGWFGLDEE